MYSNCSNETYHVENVNLYWVLNCFHHISQVPSQVSHQEFWQRYFYKVHQLELDEARKQALMRRADNAQVKEESISWDDGKLLESFNHLVELFGRNSSDSGGRNLLVIHCN